MCVCERAPGARERALGWLRPPLHHPPLRCTKAPLRHQKHQDGKHRSSSPKLKPPTAAKTCTTRSVADTRSRSAGGEQEAAGRQRRGGGVRLFFFVIAGLFPRSSWRTGANNRGNTPARTKTDQVHEDAYRGKAQEE